MIDNEKRMTKFIVDTNDKLSEWTRLLKTKFKKSFNVTLKIMTKKKYIFRDVFNRRESREYVQKILRLIKNVELNSLQNQLNIIYNDIDSSLRKNNIKRLKVDVILNAFLKNLNDCKHDWWNYEIKTLRILKKKSSINNQRFDKNDQYDKFNQSNFQRRNISNFYYNVKSNIYQNFQNFDYFDRNYQNYQNFDYDQYDYSNQIDYQQNNQNRQQNQNRYSNVVVLSISSTRLQIIVDSRINVSSNASNSNVNQRRLFQFRLNSSSNRFNNINRFDRIQFVY